MPNPSNQKIQLNFLPLNPQVFNFNIYRKECEDAQESLSIDDDGPSVKRFHLPIAPEDLGSPFSLFNVSLESIDGFEATVVKSDTNHYLTLWYLHFILLGKSTSLSLPILPAKNKFIESIDYITKSWPEGDEIVSLEPYYLRKSKLIGFLASFRFCKKTEQIFGIEVQKRSLSLNSNGKSNANNYLDIYGRLKDFFASMGKRLFPINCGSQDGSGLNVSFFYEIENRQLSPKQYIFANEQHGNSQFLGVKEYGPFEQIQQQHKIIFLFREQDKPLAHSVYYALEGRTYSTFSGMEKMFGFKMEPKTVSGHPVPDFSKEAINDAISLISSTGEPSLPVLIVPWDKTDPNEELCDDYYRIKHQFLQAKLPTQFVSTNTIRKRDGLKWSASNLALAIYGKMGGKPWKLVPKTKRCLIIGIGQAHSFSEKAIRRFFAYSILTDSSGLYETIKVLADSPNETDYLQSLSDEIISIIKNCINEYDHFVLHTPFKIRTRHLNHLKDTLLRAATISSEKKSFAVIKFNDSGRFYGFSNSNSRVPLEGTRVDLGNSQYLIWFEGASIKGNITRAISKPVHVEFLYPSYRQQETEEEKNAFFKNSLSYLQDAINLSGANWRGFNAKSSPISVYYAKIIARYIERFDRLDLEPIDLDGMPPWFL